MQIADHSGNADAARAILTPEAKQPAAGSLRVSVGFHTDRGSRERNEDYATWHVCRPEERLTIGLVAALADGMGGARGARIAAEIAARGFVEACLQQNGTAGAARIGARAAASVNRWVHAISRTDTQLNGMACTLSALILCGRQTHLVHAGDSRVYRLRSDRLTQLTTDHTLGAPGTTHALTRAIGAEGTLRADHVAETARAHDRYLLCSDGVHGALTRDQILATLSARAAPEQTARELVERATAAPRSDNATAIVIDVLALPATAFADLLLDIADLPLRSIPEVGAVIDDYELLAMLADGIHTRVFRALDRIERRSVLLKFPKPRPGLEAVQRMMTLRETWIASRVHSPYVAEAMDRPARARSCVYAVMPYYEGESLKQRLGRRPFVTLGAGIEISIKLAKAVAALHRAGIVHRDIKPENVILTPDRGLRLIDLGVAHVPELEEPVTEEPPGTASYMAPELFDGAPADERSDVFALGVTVYSMFAAGEYPYGEIEAFSRPRLANPTPLSRYRPDLPAWLGDVLARAVSADPAERFADALELAFELEHGSLHARPRTASPASLYDRNPTRFWQVVAALLLIALCAALATRT